MDNVVQFGSSGNGQGRRASSTPPPRQPALRPMGVHCASLGMFTGNLEERLIPDPNGDCWMPITYITHDRGLFCLLMNCADEPAGVRAND